MIKQITKELKEHFPFTVFGAVTGIIIMILFKNVPYRISYATFYVLHPLHVLLSSLVTASMYHIYILKCSHNKPKIWLLLVIGYVGSVGIATLSDSIIPYLGELLLALPRSHAHIGFIEKWWLINPLAIIGIAIAYFKPFTKFSHAGHVLISTWASLFHILMALGNTVGWFSYLIIGFFLIVSVLVPCCISDIVFPMLFIGKCDSE
ncbi:MAG: hypothetical protein KKH94_05740 [Candidatus Omnitrophica bacterium]|nr:hypothetical protein [Candidatus Omnitrophota bacterium]